MQRFLSIAVLAVLGAILCAPAPLRAGGIHEEFLPIINAAGPDEIVSGIVVLQERVDPERLEEEIRARGLESRWRRHEFVIRTAREIAATTQADLLSWLDEQQSSGRVESYQAFWVVNAVAVAAAPGVFDRLALRPEVDLIYANARLDLRAGWEEETPPSAREMSPNQLCVNVGPAWDQGYTGEGRLVCAFDTGADGGHIALADKWRGIQPDVEWWEAWHDPYTGSQSPFDSGTHGTHVVGIMVATPPGLDPIGIAPDADWIAAGILIGYNVQKIIAAYEWAADPDGNPATIDDVPDAVNNSWGTSHNCSPTYWEAIDVVEAAGVVNTIAVDNTGPGSGSVNSPESRADSPYQNFGVGNVNPHQSGCPIHYSSGRGPSPCDGVSIKPEVTAPGTQIYSTTPNDTYGTKTGTSMACPHVSAAVAILRQADPDLSSNELKQILMDTARDQGDAGEDNDYGWGVIDIAAAVETVLNAGPPLLPPEELAAELIPPGDVLLSWRPPSGGSPLHPVIAYNVYRTLRGEAFPEDPLVTLPAGELTYLDEAVPAGEYQYAVTANYEDGESGPSNVVEIEVPAASGVDEPVASRNGLSLEAWPNPIVGKGALRYAVQARGPARIEIFDAGGRKVTTLELAAKTGGIGEVEWRGADDAGRPLPSGVYLARLVQGEKQLRHRIVLVR
ncbi:MAG: S8 family serine peptidase [Candidatus Eisenbacteria bacterium]|nr:S8 family serine peptidase [Candidatus Eisenbacteria bacterium]